MLLAAFAVRVGAGCVEVAQGTVADTVGLPIPCQGLLDEQAGGAATNGKQPILDIVPSELHQRTPLLIGSKDDVAFVEKTIAEVNGA